MPGSPSSPLPISSSSPTPPLSSPTPPPSPPTPPPPPLADAYSNFVLAKRQAQDNLRHQPLPDTVEDALYRSGRGGEGALSEVEPRAAAVGWRGWGPSAPGPTQCSKLRVYRPHPPPPAPAPGTPPTLQHAPQPLSAIQLALCWDLRPDSPALEPRPPTHIDGSNGSAAPAVFALVPPVRPAWEDTEKTAGNGRSAAQDRPASGRPLHVDSTWRDARVLGCREPGCPLAEHLHGSRQWLWERGRPFDL
ncbi:uncharacterized protein LOC126209846 [Schistocerca nitens]|uniref:uncharacterized protein LOC126209846 n=1 Tax=Schistocerca nitens TaxID=7011 RepID=UPI002119387A|nr:uncharacterized protein LOC126209846 [Schistocerca nitens]